MVEEGVALELRPHDEQSWPQGPEQPSNARNEEHDENRQGEKGKVRREVVGARMCVAVGLKKTLPQHDTMTSPIRLRAEHGGAQHCVPSRDWLAWLRL